MEYWQNPINLPKGKVHAGSACMLLAVPEEWIATIPAIDPATQKIDGTITLIADKNWLTLSLVSQRRIFKEDSQRTEAGLTWSQSISGKTAGHSEYLHLLLGIYPQHRWVLLYKEAGSEISYLIGKPGSGAILDVAYTNDGATVSTISFSRRSSSRALLYQGDALTSSGIISLADGYLRTLTIFYTPVADVATITIPTLAGKPVIAVYRDGSYRQPIATTITDTRQVRVLGTQSTIDQSVIASTGELRLVNEDLFLANEKISVLYIG